DRLIACELEPDAAATLKRALRGEPRAKVLPIDGWMALKANVPPKERRGLVLVDPAYEDSADFLRLDEALAQAHRKWPGGLYLLWYPIKARDAADALARRLRRLNVPKILRCELSVGAPREAGALAGSGLIVVNPPFLLESELRKLLPALVRLLAPAGGSRIDWLAREERPGIGPGKRRAGGGGGWGRRRGGAEKKKKRAGGHLCTPSTYFC